MAIVQEAKRVIDVGEIGNPSTGDILYDGGVKINSNFDAVYNAFGDQRLYVGEGDGLQYIHATGYYQKVTQVDFRTPIALGTMWDVDTTSGAASPIITAGKKGESVVFVNTNGSWSVNTPLVISLASGTFTGVSGNLTISSPNSKVTCWCTDVVNGVSVWNYRVDSLFGDNKSPIEGTYSASTAGTTVSIAHMSEYDSIKLMITATNTNKTKQRVSEVILLIDSTNKVVYSTEYAVIRVGATDQEDEIINITYEINLDNYLVAKIASPVAGMRVAIKSIETQKVGAA